MTDGCHDDLDLGMSVHAPVREGGCLSCHRQENDSHPSGGGNDFALQEIGADLCFSCHSSEAFSGVYPHGPADAGVCGYCHQPHSSDQKSLLNRELNQLCLSCHSELATGIREAAFQHSAISELDCGACHLPHYSDIAGLLKGETTQLCFQCHEEINRLYERATSRHEILYTENRCANCHTAHFSDYPNLLIEEGNPLCYQCHGEVEKEVEEREHVHAPVKEEGCGVCHNPHGSNYSLILRGEYPKSFYASYEREKYGLCFQCHDSGIMEGVNTGFRNGDRNLHNVHVVRQQKGRSCRSCHRIHASDGPKLINADGVPFGNWQIPIRLEITETGGSCVPGCHRPMVYDRQEKMDNYSDKKDKTGK